VLCRHVEGELRALAPPKTPAIDTAEEAWLATRDGPLARLFDALGLDARLRHHPRPLAERARADVVRALAGEVHRASGPKVPESPAVLREELLRGLAGALMEVWQEDAARYAASESQEPDAHLTALLNSGSVRALAARLLALHRARGGSRLRDTLLTSLPRLSLMRLLVFVQLLSILCRPTESPHLGSRAERASLVSAVVEATLASKLPCLPYERDQLLSLHTSPFLSEEQRRRLVDLFTPASLTAAAGSGSPTDGRVGWDGVTCRNCGTTGVDFAGRSCTCEYCRRKAGLDCMKCNNCGNTGVDFVARLCTCECGRMKAGWDGVTCRNCGNTGVDFAGRPCTCEHGRRKAGLDYLKCKSCGNTGVDFAGRPCTCECGRMKAAATAAAAEDYAAKLGRAAARLRQMAADTAARQVRR